MSEYWDDEERHYEPEPSLELSESQKINVDLSINAGVIEQSINKFIDEIMKNKLEQYINNQVSLTLKNAYNSKIKFEEIVTSIIKSKIEDIYPDAVENKVNEFEEHIKNIKFTDRRSDFSSESITKNAKRKVDEYIENELVNSVKKSKEYIEQFSKNYFANNLFKAMGMMDKMMPVTENAQIKE